MYKKGFEGIMDGWVKNIKWCIYCNFDIWGILICEYEIKLKFFKMSI